MSVKNDPLKDLIESMIRLAQGNTENHHGTVNCEIYFQNSVIIGGKKEYPLYILAQSYRIDKDLIEKLKESFDLNVRIELIQEFYKNNSNSLEAFELENVLFSDSKVFEMLFDSSNTVELEKMIKFLQQEDLKLSDLTDSVEDFSVDMDVLEAVFNELLESKPPSIKLKKLSKFQSKIASGNSEMNADLLLPLLTHVLIKLERGHLIVGEIEFIERYAHDSSLSGINGYILTSVNAAVEVIKSIYKGKQDKEILAPPPPPPSPSHFSNLMSSISQVPKAIAFSITSTLGRSRNSTQTELEGFRERMLGTNSANDLLVRDINPLLEDYKNLLYILFKQ